jgi:hypothetical protein
LSAAEPAPSRLPSCVTVAAAWPDELQGPPPAAKKAGTPVAEGRGPLPPPLAEAEVRDLIESLGALKAQKAPGRQVRTPKARLRVVLDDVTALMVEVHAQETSKQLAGASGLGPEALKWTEETFARIRGCVAGRFEGRGPDAYRESATLVEKYRAQLEPLVLEMGRWRPEAIGPRAPVPAR